MKRKILTLVVAMLSLAILSGCATRMGQFTVASTQNVKNLDYSIADKTKQNVEGKTCIHQVLFFPIGHLDDRLQRAMDDAISNGQSKGLDGDLLVNVRIDSIAWTTLIYGQNCIEVEADLVTLDK